MQSFCFSNSFSSHHFLNFWLPLLLFISSFQIFPFTLISCVYPHHSITCSFLPFFFISPFTLPISFHLSLLGSPTYSHPIHHSPSTPHMRAHLYSPVAVYPSSPSILPLTFSLLTFLLLTTHHLCSLTFTLSLHSFFLFTVYLYYQFSLPHVPCSHPLLPPVLLSFSISRLSCHLSFARCS